MAAMFFLHVLIANLVSVCGGCFYLLFCFGEDLFRHKFLGVSVCLVASRGAGKRVMAVRRKKGATQHRQEKEDGFAFARRLTMTERDNDSQRLRLKAQERA